MGRYSLKYSCIALITCGVLFSSCENSIEKIKLVSSKEELPFETVLDVELIYSDSAQIKFILTAPLMDRYAGERPYVELKEGVKIAFYDQDMEVESQITANYAIRYEQEEMMEARNDVVVINKKGETLNTEHLIWNEKTETIRSDEFVKITTADEIIYGDGLESNQDFTQYQITNIKGTIQIKDEENPSQDEEVNEND